MSEYEKYRTINQELNWDAPCGPIRCHRCEIYGEPIEGSYSSSLEDYVDSLGPVPYTKSDVRVLILFQDPRGCKKFKAANPNCRAGARGDGQHRYFCLTKAAWDDLQLGTHTKTAKPCWPQKGMEYHYLRRYFGGTAQWSYDGFLAYFLFRFRVMDALITNVSKCHFAKGSVEDWAANCVPQWLMEEATALNPNLILSFSRAAEKILKQPDSFLGRLPWISIFHPGYPCDRKRREKDLLRALEESSSALNERGLNSSMVISEVKKDIESIEQYWSK